MVKWWNKGSLRQKWAASFFIVLILPMLLNYISYIFLYNSMQYETNKSNRILYKNLSKEVNVSLSKFKKIGVDLGVNRCVQDISMLSGMPQMSDAQSQELKNLWDRYYIDFNTTYLSFIYFSSLDMAASNNGFQSAKEQYDLFLSQYNVTNSEWKQWLSEPEDGFLHFKGLPNVNNETPNYLAIKYKIYENRRVEPTSLVVMLRDDFFKTKFSDTFDQYGMEFELIHKDGSMIASTFDNTVDNQALYASLQETDALLETKINQTDYVVSYDYDMLNQWYYIFYTPKHAYYKLPNMMNLAFLAGVLISVLIGTLIIRAIVKKQYSPVKNIIEKLPDADGAQNEYVLIENTILDAVKRQKESQSVQEKNKKRLFALQLMQLLNGILSEHDLTVHRELKQGVNAVVVFSLDHYAALFAKETIEDEERRQLLVEILENIGSEIFEKQDIASYYVKHMDYAITIIHMDKPVEALAVNDCINEILTNIKKYFLVEMRAYVSKQYEGIGNLSESYRQALYCAEFDGAGQRDNVIFYEDIEDESVSKAVLRVDDGNLFNNYIKSSQEAQANRLIDQLVDGFVKSPKNHPVQCKYFINDIISHIIRNFSDDIDEKNTCINTIYRLTAGSVIDFAAVKEHIHVLVKEICGKQEEKNHTLKASKLIDMAKQFIEENYQSSALSCDSIAAHCGVSNSYISRLFRSDGDGGILNYINRTRIRRSKEMMQQDHLRIEDIAKRVGFDNVNTFIRLFKKFEGITPGAYRKTIVKDS